MGASDAFLKAPPAEVVADAAAAIGAAAALAAAPMKEATEAPAADALHSLGLMRIGDAVLALPVATLREVLPCPDVLSPLPVVAVGLRGAVQ